MSTLKLKKPAVKGGAPKGREPVRAAGVKRVHPTLAQAQAERALAAKRRTPRSADGPPRGPMADRRDGLQARLDRPPGHQDRHPPVLPAAQAQRAATPTGEPLLPRLSKRMSELGLASRREADAWIEQGFVKVDGEVVDQLGTRVRPEQQIEIDPAARHAQAQRVTVLLHKPLGVVSGQAEDGHTPAVALITAANRWRGDASQQRFNASQLRHLVPAGSTSIPPASWC